ncbi:hypothetical protein SESBI_03941 [Sesbania bispinosa]|nr:hypothetical protein SESBI_03941 [Sesbania bispinosa]
MNVLDSHVEALAFNYLNFGLLTILNNLWTWLALLTAALSYWKIRSTGYPKPKSNDPIVEPLFTPDVVKPEAEAARQTPVVNGVSEDVDGVTKGKFTVYYKEEDMQCGPCESDGLLTAFEGEGRESEWWKCWERVLMFRNGEKTRTGWYTCQDLTELNGNVVRFWDGGLRFGTRESGYSSAIVFVSELIIRIVIALLDG